MHVLFVCTGNLCRSPSAEAFFTKLLAANGPQGVTVSSAGIRGSLRRTPDTLVDEGHSFGLDLVAHESRVLGRQEIDRSELIIGMARDHVREILVANPKAFSRTFTLREMVRRGQLKGPRYPGETLFEWLLRVGAGRRPMDLMGDAAIDDTPDPMGGDPEDFRHMFEELDNSTRFLHSLLWPPPVPEREL
jgi:protein-tyrosine-phosphatase